MAKKRSDKATAELLREVGIYNQHNLASTADIAYVDYRPVDNGLGGHGAKWQIVWPGHQTDPDGWWGNHGHKTFTLFRPGTAAERKTAALADALEWCEAQWGTPSGGWKKFRILSDSWWPADILDATIAELLGES